LVFGGCGAAIFDATFPQYGIGFGGVTLAFGLAFLTMIYAVRYISGGHFNPPVTVWFWVSGRFSDKDVLPYIVIQFLAAGVLFPLNPCHGATAPIRILSTGLT